MRVVTIVVLCVVIVLLWLLTTLPAYGATYYVAPGGSNGNAGSLAAPFQTILYAQGVMGSGDTLVIRAGTYNETINGYTIPLPSGTSWATATTFMGAAGEWPILKGCLSAGGDAPSYIIFKDFICDGTGDPDATGAAVDSGHHIRLDNLEIRNYAGNGLYLHTPTEYIELLRNRVHDNSENFFDQGIYHAGKNSLLDGNQVYTNGAFGIQVWKDGGGNDGNVVVNNVVYGNGGGGNCCAGLVVGFGHNALVANNVAYNEAGLAIQVTNNGYTLNNQVYNNTVYNSGVGIQLGPGADQTKVKNNILWAVTTAINNLGMASDISHSLTTNPLFVNAGAADFHLQAGSPAINAGTTLASVTTDIAGTARPQGGSYDIGAYEYADEAGPPATSNPIYVKKTGLDTYDCVQAENPATPKLTIGSAWACMTVAGKTMVISGGTYSERIDTLTQPLTGGLSAAARTTIQAAPGETVVLALPSDAPLMVALFFRNSDAFLHVKDLVIDAMNRTDSNALAIYGPSHDLLFENVTVRNATYETLYIAGGTNLVFQAPTIHQSTSSCVGMDGDTSGVVFRDGTIHHCTGSGIRAHAAGAVGRQGPDPRTGTGVNVVIERMRITDTSGDGLTLGPSTSALILNNIVSQNGTGIRITAGASGALIAHNTVTANTGRSLQCDSGATTISLTNNIFYGNGMDPILNNCGATATTNLTTNPAFVNAGAKDYRLTAGSPAINTGTTLLAVPVDLVGVTRPQGAGYDMGAYEYVGPAEAPPTRVPYYLSHFFVY